MFNSLLLVVASLCDVSSSLPQVWKSRHRMTTHNLALGMVLLRLLGASCWTIWGYFHLNLNILLVLSPAISWLIEFLLLCCILRDVIWPLNDSEYNDESLKVSNMTSEQGT